MTGASSRGPATAPFELYRTRRARAAAAARTAAARSRRLANLRLAIFLAAVAAALAPELLPLSPVPFYLLALALAGVFFWLAGMHEATKRRLAWALELETLATEGEARLERRWAQIPVPAPAASPEHPYALDLDVVGRASLLHLAWRGGTARGGATLARWLLSPAPPQEARARQQAVAELASLVDLREELAARGRLGPDLGPRRTGAFLGWAEEEPWLAGRPGLRAAAWLVPGATLALAALALLGIVPGSLWLLPPVAGLLVSATTGRDAFRIYDRAFPAPGVFAHYPGVFRCIAGADFRAPRLHRLREELAGAGGAERAFHRLDRLMSLADLRRSMLYLPIQAVTLWDVHVLRGLEAWKRRWGRSARGWFDAVAEAEALAALAGLAHDHPDWSFPAFAGDEGDDGDATRYVARGLGHPLLQPGSRVDNDVAVGPPGSFLLVTGSNMSGKSTLLRAIGLNAVLAQAGGPVCARELRLPPVALHTAMRVQDSLERGVSYFMAELARIRTIVDAARANPAGGALVLYLLDEILHGTNTAERQIAARRIILTLLDARAIGAVTTHDLTLAEAEELRAAAESVHFSETVNPGAEGAAAMTFDYCLRPGPATSTNALRLMKLMGLPADD
jgi:hypothetical protein